MINPTPPGFGVGEDNQWHWTPDLTAHIVRKVRCEARDAMFKAAARLLEGYPYSEYPGTDKIIDSLKNNPSDVRQRNKWDIDPIAQTRMNYFVNASAKYGFDLQITETDNNAISAGLSPSSGPHVLKVNITDFSTNLTRFLKRTFDVPATSFDRHQKINCYYDSDTNAKKLAELKDIIYPMRGSIDIAKSINFFIAYATLDTTSADRHEWAMSALEKAISDATNGYWKSYDKVKNLALSAKNCNETQKRCENVQACYVQILKYASVNYNKKIYDKVGIFKEPPTVTDQLKFTTDINGGVNPSITFDTAGASLKLANLGYTFKPGRKDIHQLTLAITAPGRVSEPNGKRPEYSYGGKNGYELVLKAPPKKLGGPLAIQQCMALTPKPAKPLAAEIRGAGPPPMIVAPPAEKGLFTAVPVGEAQQIETEKRLDRAMRDQQLLLNNQRLQDLIDQMN